MRIVTITITMMLIWLTACMQKTAEQRFINYVNDPKHKITQQIRVGEVQTTVKWLSADYLELKRKIQNTDTASDDGTFYYFDVRFDKSQGDKPAKEKLRYLDFDMQKDFVLLADRDSVMPVICQKIENGISGSYQYMLAFEKTEGDYRDFTLIYRDQVFGTGVQVFVYRRKDIAGIPKLKRE